MEGDLIKILHEGFDFKIEMLMCIANAKVDTPSVANAGETDAKKFGFSLG